MSGHTRGIFEFPLLTRDIASQSSKFMPFLMVQKSQKSPSLEAITSVRGRNLIIALVWPLVLSSATNHCPIYSCAPNKSRKKIRMYSFYSLLSLIYAIVCTSLSLYHCFTLRNSVSRRSIITRNRQTDRRTRPC